MLKRENEFEKDGKMEEIKEKYNIEEIFKNVWKEEENEEKKNPEHD